MNESVFHAILPGRDELHLTLADANTQSACATLSAVGCSELLDLCSQWRPKLVGEPKSWPIPEGLTHSEILLRELLLKARGEWQLPYQEDELCHCRVVPTAVVDAAIVTGAHTVPMVSRRTSAGTSCGTCQPNIDKLLQYRLKCRTA